MRKLPFLIGLSIILFATIGICCAQTTINGNYNFTGQVNCHNFENIRCVDAANSAGWSGSSLPQWIASAIASLPFYGGIVWVDGNVTASITSTIVLPPNTKLIFNAVGDVLTCNTGATPCFQLNGGQSTIDGFSQVIPGTDANGTWILRGTTTGPLIDVDWTTSTNANIINDQIRNLYLDDEALGNGDDCLLARSVYSLTIENVHVDDAECNGFHFQDDKPSSVNNLQAKAISLRNLLYTGVGGSGIGYWFDASNGGGISEAQGATLHCDMSGAQQCAKFSTGTSAAERQISQMHFETWTVFDDGSTYAFQFDSPTGTNFLSNTGGNYVDNISFSEVDIENTTGSPGTQTVPAIGCTIAGSANGNGCAGLSFGVVGGGGYQGGTWPDGVDYTNLGYGSSVLNSTAQFGVLGHGATFKNGIFGNGGTCSMVSATTCTSAVTFGSHCIAQDTASTSNQGKCGISTGTLTVTAASSNSDTWAWSIVN